MGPVETNFSEILIKKLIHENASEHVVCEITTILTFNMCAIVLFFYLQQPTPMRFIINNCIAYISRYIIPYRHIPAKVSK